MDEDLRSECAILEVLPDIIFIYDWEGNFIDCKTNVFENLLFDKEFFIGKNLKEVLPNDIAEKGIDCINMVFKTNTVQSFEYVLEIKSVKKYFETRMVKYKNNKVLAIVRDITSIKREHQLMYEMLYKDSLTGLFNRRYLDEILTKEKSEVKVPELVIMIDINGLKHLNDKYGSSLGDELIIKISSCLNNVCSSQSVLLRTGGDEFVVIVYEKLEDYEAYINNIYQLIRKIRIGNSHASVTIGWDSRTENNNEFYKMLTNAENHIYRKKLTERNSIRNEVIKVIMSALSEKNEREKKHSEQVSSISFNIGKAMNMSEQILKEIEIAGLLHDIGKIGISDEILNKSGFLTDDEYSEIKKHPFKGFQILKSVDEYSMLARYVLYHHERWDGKGYPEGLCGEDIPIISRIISVADAYEAMISDRTYRKGVSKQKAVEEIIKNAGTQFDPNIVSVFVGSFA